MLQSAQASTYVIVGILLLRGDLLQVDLLEGLDRIALVLDQFGALLVIDTLVRVAAVSTTKC